MPRRRLNDLANQRSQALSEASAAIETNNHDAYSSAMERVTNINADIERCRNLIAEQERNVILSAPSAAETTDMRNERAEALRRGDSITLTQNEIIRSLRNITLASGPITQPTGSGTEIHDNIGACSVLDLVTVQDMTGLSMWEEPYAISDPTPQVQTVAANTGSARTASDPTFGVSQVKPYEVTTTSYVDRNIARLSPAQYAQKIETMALRALRNKISALCLLGDAESTHVMYGMANGTNKAGASIVAASAASAIDVDLLQTLYFEYGDDLTIGANARAFMSKKVLAIIGKLRGTNEKKRLFDVTPTAGDANQGMISDGGIFLPYSLNGGLSSGSTETIIYGDPANYLLGLFGDYTVRLDESYKAGERLLTVLGDAMVGGNVVVDKGFVVARI